MACRQGAAGLERNKGEVHHLYMPGTPGYYKLVLHLSVVSPDGELVITLFLQMAGKPLGDGIHDHRGYDLAEFGIGEAGPAEDQ